MPLTRSAIVAAGIEILDSYGLGDLTMRRVAGVLDVHGGALYHHVANKQTLLAAMADAILADLPAPRGAADALLTTWAHAFRAALLAHRDGAELVASVLSLRLAGATPIAQLAALLEGAVDEPRTVAAATVHLVLGHTMDEQGHAQLVELGVARSDDADPEGLFAASLALLVAGVSAASPETPRSGRSPR